MSTPDTTPTETIRPTYAGFIVVLFLLLLAACSPSAPDDVAAPDVAEDDVAEDEITLTSSATEQQSPRQRLVATQIVFAEANARGDDPFAPEAEIAECRPEELIAYLDANPTVAAAWADAAGVEVDRIAETIAAFTPTVLSIDTRVTNHAYRSGVARGFQASLESGTAVLVDDLGVARVRCACGNPLLSPRPVGEETPEQTPTTVPTEVPVTTTSTVPTEVPTQRPADFCATWHAVRDSMTGGPVAPGVDGMAEYFERLVAGFDQLIAAAEATDGFPAGPLADIVTYRNAIAAADPANPGPGPEDALVGLRVEEFLLAYCDGDVAGDAVEDLSLIHI